MTAMAHAIIADTEAAIKVLVQIKKENVFIADCCEIKNHVSSLIFALNRRSAFYLIMLKYYDIKDSQNRTPLMYAAMELNEDAVQKLIFQTGQRDNFG